MGNKTDIIANMSLITIDIKKPMTTFVANLVVLPHFVSEKHSVSVLGLY